MALLFDEDYLIIKESGLVYEEDENNRFLIIKNYPLPVGLYTSAMKPIEQVEVLWAVPSNYNTSGGDMFWIHPELKRADGKAIPNVSCFGGADARFSKEKEYCRWSRHCKAEAWKPKVDSIQKVLARIEWALQNPDANRNR